MTASRRIVPVGTDLGARIVSAKHEPRLLPTKEIQP